MKLLKSLSLDKLHHSPNIKILEALCCRGVKKASCKAFVSAMKDECVGVFACVCMFMCVHTTQDPGPRIIRILILGYQVLHLNITVLSICHTSLQFHPLYFLVE